MPFILFVILALLLLILVGGAYMFCVACIRRKELPWLVEEKMKETVYAKYYDTIVCGDRFIKEHQTKEVWIESFDGLKLCGSWIAAENPKGTILLAHGYRSSKLVDFSLAYKLYHDWGMNILVPDQRAHGKSEGKLITFGVKESRDMQAWIAYHNAHFGKYPMILSGMSMGAATMLYLADADLPDNVKGIIADCGFTSPKAILDSVFRRVMHFPAGPVLVAAELFARLFGGFSFSEKDTRKTLRNSKLPVFMVHGTQDGFVPCEMTEQGYAACAEPKELLLVEGADHGVSFLVARQQYTERILRFLEKYVENAV